MLTRERLVKQLEVERTALASLLSERARIDEAIAKNSGRVAMLEELLGRVPLAGLPGESRTGRQRRSAPGSLQDGSRIARVYDFLREAGESKHVGEILAGIGETDSPRKRDGMSSQIARYVKAGRLFVRDEARGARFFGVMADSEDPGEREAVV